MRFAPFVTNKKHSNTNKDENTLFFINLSKIGRSIEDKFIEKKIMKNKKVNIIKTNLVLGLSLILISSKNPNKNKKNDKKISSKKSFWKKA